MRLAVWPTLAVLLLPASVAAQEKQDTSFKNVEYLSGDSALQEKQKGTLFVSATVVRLSDKKGVPLLTIPFTTIQMVKDSLHSKSEGAVKKKVMGKLGFGSSGPEQRLIITAKRDSAAAEDTIVFKIKEEGQAPQIASLIRWRMNGESGEAGAAGAGDDAAAADAGPPPRMLVANPYVADAADSAAAVEVGTAMRASINQFFGDKLEVVSRDVMNKVLEPYGYPPDAILSQSLVTTLATSIEADVLISGTMKKGSDGKYTIETRLGGVADTTSKPTTVAQNDGETLAAFGTRIAEVLKGPQSPAEPAPAP